MVLFYINGTRPLKERENLVVCVFGLSRCVSKWLSNQWYDRFLLSYRENFSYQSTYGTDIGER